ncbi:hypothetical protein DEJ50_29480 [Streptomyces venezuelae]|uniref:Uncharacterized protein n=1 Tax=Streptomyces venezuelae TaxID=54571 RepID=A0A5P2D9X0_STRVZ|nr:hypothetical protein [Streptomyces venezuelae]QES51360.1 hypothetical protein DEJ50_29480 [Streptomyces venezuelae]
MTTVDNEADTAARRPATAWPLENAVFSAAMVAQRLPWVAAPARALGLGLELGPDALSGAGVTRLLPAYLRRTGSGQPVQVRTPFGTFLVPSGGAGEAEDLLVRAEEAGALGPAVGLTAGGRRYGLSPHATAACEPAVPVAELAAPVAEEVGRLLMARRGDGTLEWDDWYGRMLRLSRRVVVAAAAAEDTLLSEVLAATTAAAGTRTYASRAAALRRRLALYPADGDPAAPEAGAPGAAVRDTGAPGAAVPEARSPEDAGPEDRVPGVAHLLALVSEAAAGTSLQALALLAVGAAATPEEAVAEALRRFPPVTAAVYPVLTSFTWRDLAVESGTEILFAPGADAGVPSGPAGLCEARSGCAATGFAARVAEEIVSAVAAAARPVVISPELGADRLPAALDPRTLLVALLPLGDLSDLLPVHGSAPAAYGSLARASSARLDRHAESLAACAGHNGWNADESGERFRMILLGHAARCAEAADDVRRAAQRLAD